MSRTLASALDHWIRHRLRAYAWKQWRLPRTRVKNLMERGAARKWAAMVGNTRKGAWRLSKNGTVCAALSDDWFTRSALLPLSCIKQGSDFVQHLANDRFRKRAEK